MSNQELLWHYFKTWVETYKTGAVRDVTMHKYTLSLMWVTRLGTRTQTL
jgi:hypothetical protein